MMNCEGLGRMQVWPFVVRSGRLAEGMKTSVKNFVRISESCMRIEPDTPTARFRIASAKARLLGLKMCQEFI